MLPNPYTKLVERTAQIVDEIIDMAEKNREKLTSDVSNFAKFGDTVIDINLQITDIFTFAYLYSMSVVASDEYHTEFQKTGSLYIEYKSDGVEITFWVSGHPSEFNKTCRGYLDAKNEPSMLDNVLYRAVCDITGEISF